MAKLTVEQLQARIELARNFKLANLDGCKTIPVEISISSETAKNFGYDSSKVKDLLTKYEWKITKETMPEVIKWIIKSI